MNKVQLSGRILTLITTFFLSLAASAQAKIDVNINKDGGGSTWYMQPWVWVVGAAVFILLLVALLRGNSARD